MYGRTDGSMFKGVSRLACGGSRSQTVTPVKFCWVQPWEGLGRKRHVESELGVYG